MSTISILNCGNFRLRASRCYKMSFQRNSVILQCCFFSNKEVYCYNICYISHQTHILISKLLGRQSSVFSGNMCWRCRWISLGTYLKKRVKYHRRISTMCIILRVAVCQISGCRMVTVLNVRVVILTLL